MAVFPLPAGAIFRAIEGEWFVAQDTVNSVNPVSTWRSESVCGKGG